jgi:hypothetical protein
MTRTAILGWGSLLWDKSQRQFEEQHDEWHFDGPVLKVEFSRKSASRLYAFMLVIDPTHGQECQVAYALSKREKPEEALADLRKREKTNGSHTCTTGGASPIWTGLLNCFGMLVPGGGVEPPRPEGRRILSPLRLPVPPSRPFEKVVRVSHIAGF